MVHSSHGLLMLVLVLAASSLSQATLGRRNLESSGDPDVPIDPAREIKTDDVHIANQHKILHSKLPSFPPRSAVPCPTKRRFFSQEEVTARRYSKTMLYSIEGSGNTWSRFLLENSTGIYTGDIYYDPSLARSGFQEAYAASDVIAIKTHLSGMPDRPAIYYANVTRVIALVRNPFHSMIAERKRHVLWSLNVTSSQHTSYPTWAEFAANAYEPDGLVPFVYWLEAHAVPRWSETLARVHDVLNNDGVPVLIMKYENLKNDTTRNLARMLDFIGQNPDLAVCPAQSLSTGRRPSPVGYPECVYTQKQLKFILAKIPEMSLFGYTVPEECQAVLKGTVKGGTDAVPVHFVNTPEVLEGHAHALKRKRHDNDAHSLAVSQKTKALLQEQLKAEGHHSQ